MEHPRWGSIMCVASIRKIKSGEEIFTNYGYAKAKAPEDFPWYHEALEKLEEDERKEKEKEVSVKKKTKKTKKRSKMSIKKQ